MSHTEPHVTNGHAKKTVRLNDWFTGKNPLQFKTNIPDKSPPEKEPRPKPETDPTVAQDPFDDSFLNHVIGTLKKHGPAASKIIFLTGTAAATFYAGLAVESVTATLMIWGCGFILECLFAYSWAMTGDERLAGEQHKIIQRIFKVSSVIMMGDLATMLLDNQAGFHMLFIVWTSGVQTTAAAFLMWQLYRLKHLHPVAIANREVVNLKAGMRAAAIRDKAFDQRLMLAEKEHERALKWAALEARHYHSMRRVNSRWYNKQIKRETKRAIGQGVGSAAEKIKQLPQLLSIGGEPKQKPSTPAKKARRGWLRRK